MPRIIVGHLGNLNSFGDIISKDLGYEYPKGLDLRPGKSLHDKIVSEVMRRATEASSIISARFSTWNRIDETLTTYIETDEDEDKITAKDSRKPVSIVYPYSYAVLETILSYLIAAFFQDPIFRYEGVSPEDTIGAISLEKVNALHCNKSKIGLNLHTLFRDSLSYGFGICGPSWKKTYGKKIVVREEQRLFRPNLRTRATVEEVTFEGNELNNIDPYLCLPDPSVSIVDIQKGEFFGWIDHNNYYSLLEEEKHNKNIFNVKYLKNNKSSKSGLYSGDSSGRHTKSGVYPDNSNISSPADVVRMFIKIIPKEWKLGESEYPEKWMFAVAADNILIEARPLGLVHDLFPVAVTAPDHDGYSSSPISRMESLYGLQHTLDWMVNTHIANVRKTMNNTFVVDPYLVNVPDFEEAKSGGVIRIRRPAWGRGTRDAVTQLQVTDVTRGHLADTGFIKEAMDRIAATDSWTMGSLRQGGPERLTGKEFESTKQGAFTRLEKVARIIGLQAMQDIGTMFAHHTQQFMSQETYLDTTGRWQEDLLTEFTGDAGAKWQWNGQTDKRSRYKITPYDLLINYDVKVRDGSIPGSNYSGVWMKMMELLATNPELQQTFDIVRIFKHIARNNGAKNVQEFLKVKTLPTERAEGAVQQGNMVPIDQILGGGS